MTNEEKVKAKYPEAHVAPIRNANYPNFYIIRGDRKQWSYTRGRGFTPEKAWADAARNLDGAQ